MFKAESSLLSVMEKAEASLYANNNTVNQGLYTWKISIVDWNFMQFGLSLRGKKITICFSSLLHASYEYGK